MKQSPARIGRATTRAAAAAATAGNPEELRYRALGASQALCFVLVERLTQRPRRGTVFRYSLHVQPYYTRLRPRPLYSARNSREVEGFLHLGQHCKELRLLSVAPLSIQKGASIGN